MLCRIDVLARDEKKVRVLATRLVIGASLREVQQTADRERERFNAPGYRVRDLHTDRVEEVWN